MSDISPMFVATLSEQVLPKISDQIFKRCVLWDWMRRNKVFMFKKGGKNIQFRIRKSKSSLGGATNDWLQRNPKTSNAFETVTVEWTQYSFSLLMSKFQAKRNKNASNVAKMFDAEAEQVKELYQSAMERFATYAYGDGTAVDSDDLAVPFDGLQKICHISAGASTNTYAGINRTTSSNAFWRNQVQAITNFDLDDNGNGVTNGVEGMKTLWNECSVGKQEGDKTNDKLAQSREEPSGTITTQTIYEQYENSLMGQFRYVDDSDVDPIKKLSFHGKPIDWDTFCPSGKIYMVNFDHLFVWCTEDDGQLLSIYDDGSQGQGTVKTITIGSQVQQWCDKPSSCGVASVA